MDDQETYDFFENVTAPLGLFSAIVCGFATITSYMYPQQRKFPNVVLVWTWYELFFYHIKIKNTKYKM